MTLDQFTTFRKKELLAFFKARYGRPWRRIVTQQSGLNPRTFDYWNRRAPLSLYRQVSKLETWARTVGFESPTDVAVQVALLRSERFKKTAAEEVALAKRKQAARAREAQKSHEMEQKIREAMSRAFATHVQSAPASPASN